jgi:DNA-binding CsgD family transcriptional regulator
MTTRLGNIGVGSIPKMERRGSVQDNALDSIPFQIGDRACWAVRASDADLTADNGKGRLFAERDARNLCGWLCVGDQTYLVLAQTDVVAGVADYPPAMDEPWETLSERETQIAVLVSRGKGTKQIAGFLRISEHTVRSYMRRIFAKLRVSTRPAMVAHLMKSSIVLADLTQAARKEREGR